MSDTHEQVRAAIYLRQSLDAEDDKLAIGRQREDCEALVADRGWVLVREYVDNDRSASRRDVRRPGYEEMMADYRGGAFTAIVVWDLDRLTRQPRQMEDLIDESRTRGLTLATVTGDSDLETDNGRMFTRVKSAVMAAEVERKSVRQSRAHKQRAVSGRGPRGIRPFGLALSGREIPHEAALVRGIAAAFLKGASLRAICRVLDGQADDVRVGPGTPERPMTLHQHPRPSHVIASERNEKRLARAEEDGLDLDTVTLSKVPAPHPWNPSSLVGILRNPRLAGYSVYTERTEQARSRAATRKLSIHPRTSGQERIVRTDGGEAVRGEWDTVIDPEIWWAIQRKLDDPKRTTNRTGKTSRTNLGTSLFRCAVCGDTVRSHGGDRYRCVNGCLVRTREPIDTFVLGVMAETLRQPDITERWNRGDQDDPKVAELQQQITDHRGRIARAEADYDAGHIEGRDLKRIRERAEAAIAEIDRQLTARVHGSVVSPILTQPSPAEVFLAADIDTQRRIIELLATVHLDRGTRGRKTFAPSSVRIEWINEAAAA